MCAASLLPAPSRALVLRLHVHMSHRCCCRCRCCRSMWPRLLPCCFLLLQVESDALQLASGVPWQGEGPFPVG
jgi:hypothetical protein